MSTQFDSAWPDLQRLSPPQRNAWNMVPESTDTTAQMNLAALPEGAQERLRKCPFLDQVVSLVDGNRDVCQIVDLIEDRVGHELEPKEVKRIVTCLRVLSSLGYVQLRYKARVNETDIIQTLKKCGLRSGDAVLVHSSLSAAGHVLGGAQAVIDALMKTVGPRGLLAMPTFYDDAVIAVTGCGMKQRYPPNPPHIPSPYDSEKSPAYTGSIPNAFWPRDDVIRSKHPTHSVAASGERAEWFVQGHEPGRSAFERGGPFGKLVDLDGCVVFLGAGLHSMTFLHVLEEWLELPYMPTATVQTVLDGKVKTVTSPKYPEGHRSFYLPEPNKVTRAIAESGIQFSTACLGLTEVRLVRAREVHKRLSAWIRREPDLLLCDSDECSFCVWAKSRIKQQGVP